MERLQKFISNSGYTSRRNAEKLISEGKVKVNFKIVKEMGIKVSKNDVVSVNGKVIESISNNIYIVLNKPTGYITTTSDEFDRRKVLDLIKNIKVRIYPIGRLDYDTSGVLLLTNDGELTNKLTQPSSDVEKEYIVKVNGIVSKENLKKLEKGVIIDGYKTKKCIISTIKINSNSNKTILNIIITEGKNNQIRKMFESIGNDVIKLKRIRISSITTDGLKYGEYRFLNAKEVKELNNI